MVKDHRYHLKTWSCADICAINQNQYEDKGELQASDISHLATVVRKVCWDRVLMVVNLAYSTLCTEQPQLGCIPG